MKTGNVLLHNRWSTFLEAMRNLNPEAARSFEAGVPPMVLAALSGCSESFADAAEALGEAVAACRMGTTEQSRYAVHRLLNALARAEQQGKELCAVAEVGEEQLAQGLKHLGKMLAAAARQGHRLDAQ